MSPIHYTAKVLSDGHLPLPENFVAKTGDEVEVVLMPANGDLDSRKKDPAGYFLEHWAGTLRGSGEPVAEQHDEYLYGDRS